MCVNLAGKFPNGATGSFPVLFAFVFGRHVLRPRRRGPGIRRRRRADRYRSHYRQIRFAIRFRVRHQRDNVLLR